MCLHIYFCKVHTDKLIKREVTRDVVFVAGASYARLSETDRSVQCCERPQVVMLLMLASKSTAAEIDFFL